MTDIFDLKKIEGKFHLSYLQDGLWDIFLGLFFITMGLLFYFSIESFLVIIPAGYIALLMFIKRSFAVSRLGYLNFSEERRTKEKNKYLLMVVLGLFGFYFGVMIFFTAVGGRAIYDFLDSLPANPIAIFIAIAVMTVTAVFGVRRFVIYSFLIIFIFIIGDILGDDIVVPSILIGIIILATGVVILVRFMRKYPKIEGGIHDELIN
jgi:hypothetical protein